MDALIDDFIRRCELVRDLGGGSASQYLSSHIKEVKNKVAMNEDKMWKIDENLLNLQAEFGNKWKLIGNV